MPLYKLPKIKSTTLFPDKSYKKRIHVSPDKGPKFVFEGNGVNEVEVGDELDIGHVKQAYEGVEVETHTFITFAPNTMDKTPLAK